MIPIRLPSSVGTTSGEGGRDGTERNESRGGIGEAGDGMDTKDIGGEKGSEII